VCLRREKLLLFKHTLLSSLFFKNHLTYLKRMSDMKRLWLSLVIFLSACQEQGPYPSLATVPARVEPLLSDAEVKELKEALEQEQKLTLKEAQALTQ